MAASTFAADPLASLGIADREKYRIIPRVPIFHAHPPIRKAVKVGSAVTEDNPEGRVMVEVGADEDDLREMAENANRQVARGRPPLLQIGHTRIARDVPESARPRHVGVTTNHAVGDFEGTPCIFADLHVLKSQYDEASTYPRPSAERVGWGEGPGRQGIKATAILRGDPELDLGLIPYHREDGSTALICYAKDLPDWASHRKERPVTAMLSPTRHRGLPRISDPQEARILVRALTTNMNYREAKAAVAADDLSAKVTEAVDRVVATYGRDAPSRGVDRAPARGHSIPTDRDTVEKVKAHALHNHQTFNQALAALRASGGLVTYASDRQAGTSTRPGGIPTDRDTVEKVKAHALRTGVTFNSALADLRASGHL